MTDERHLQAWLKERGFDWSSGAIVIAVSKLADGGSVEFYDKELARALGCTTKSVQRWRNAYLRRSKELAFRPLDIRRGKYDRQSRAYTRTAYSLQFARSRGEVIPFPHCFLRKERTVA